MPAEFNIPFRRQPLKRGVAEPGGEINYDVDRAALYYGSPRFDQAADGKFQSEVKEQEEDSGAAHEFDERGALNEAEVERPNLRRMRAYRHPDQDQEWDDGET